LEDKAAAFEQETGIPTVVFSKQNPAHWSYGGWNLALQEHCEDINFAFLFEDDYLPVMRGFDKEWLSYSYSTDADKESVLICVGHWSDSSRLGPHAACSIGLINVALFNKYGGSFYLPAGSVAHGPATQVSYLRSFVDKGLSIRSMSADYCISFMDCRPNPLPNDTNIVYLDNSLTPRPLVFAPVELPIGAIMGHQVQLEREQLVGLAPASTRERDSGGFHILGGA